MNHTENPAIEIRDLTKIYQMGTEKVYALNGVSLTIESGEFIAITGPSGSGKSTLLGLLGCLDTPTSGRLDIDGVNVATLNADELAHIRNEKIGFVFQDFHLMPQFTALENIMLPLFYGNISASERTERALTALERVGLSNRKGHRPHELSGGQCQRVAIARALVMNPAFILADEPTGNLDSQVGLEILKLFEDLNQNSKTTLVLITHDADVAKRAHRQIKILDGKIENKIEEKDKSPNTDDITDLDKLILKLAKNISEKSDL